VAFEVTPDLPGAFKKGSWKSGVKIAASFEQQRL
jgi:hypothetical protein